jgi:hypothetical protein
MPLTVHAVLVLVKIITTRLVGCPTMTAIPAPVMAATPAATTTATAAACMPLIAQVPHWAVAVSTLPLAGVVLVMMLWGLVVAMGWL